jgi:putative effector of murein hydrolase
MQKIPATLNSYVILQDVQWSVFLPILATIIVASRRTGFLLRLTYLSYARYANEAFVIANARRLVHPSFCLR